MSRLFIFRGPSSSGKSTVEESIISNGMVAPFVIHTTRAPRPGEESCKPYVFVDSGSDLPDGIRIDIPGYASYVYNLAQLDNQQQDLVISIIDDEPISEIVKALKSVHTEVYIIDFSIPLSVRESLLRNRGDSEDDIKVRLTRGLGEREFNASLVLDNIYSATHKVEAFIREIQSPSAYRFMAKMSILDIN